LWKGCFKLDNEIPPNYNAEEALPYAMGLEASLWNRLAMYSLHVDPGVVKG